MYIGEMGLPRNFEARFIPVTESGCWLWIGGASRFGYGAYWHPVEKRLVTAHRFSYECLKGEIPAGLQIDHLCRVPCCVNPDHLEAVTPKENTLRSNSVSAIKARQIHCSKGHPLSGDNLVRDRGTNARRCLLCLRTRVNAYNKIYRVVNRTRLLANMKEYDRTHPKAMRGLDKPLVNSV